MEISESRRMTCVLLGVSVVACLVAFSESTSALPTRVGTTSTWRRGSNAVNRSAGLSAAASAAAWLRGNGRNFLAFNQEAKIRKEVISRRAGAGYHSLGARADSSKDGRGSVTTVNMTLMINSVANVDGSPYRYTVESLICLTWINEALTWDPSKYKNVSSVTSYLWSIWSPRLIYFQSQQTPAYATAPVTPFARVQANGRCRWCTPARLVALCEADDDADAGLDSANSSSSSDRGDSKRHRCAATMRLEGFPEAPVKFQRLYYLVSRTLDLPSGLATNISLTHSGGRRGVAVSDEATLAFLMLVGSPLDFAAFTWPTVCVAAMMLANCCTSGSVYDFFSPRTWIALFTAISCGLTIDHNFHPRLANQPLVTWLLGVHALMGALALAEAAYPAVCKRLNLPSASTALPLVHALPPCIVRFGLLVVACLLVSISL